ncbi:unnamed protein product [Linum trigynum]|uniref:Uncharacterized protein n=1 Tax=Linum trigynum TaxID=586398 RepID=A0AAV2G2R6_9ROSI
MKVTPAGGGDPAAGSISKTFKVVMLIAFFSYGAIVLISFALLIATTRKEHAEFCLTPGVMLASGSITGGGAGGFLQLAVDVEFPCEEETARVHYDALEASVVVLGGQHQIIAVARLPPFYANRHSILNLRLHYDDDEKNISSSADLGFQLLASFRRLNKKDEVEGHEGSIRAACHPVTIGPSSAPPGPDLAANLDCDVELLRMVEVHEHSYGFSNSSRGSMGTDESKWKKLSTSVL